MKITLTAEELAAERAASRARRAAAFERATGVRPHEKVVVTMRDVVVGKGHATRKPRWRTCPCGEEFVVTHGHQKWCPACRADYAKSPHRRYKKHGKPAA